MWSMGTNALVEVAAFLFRVGSLFNTADGASASGFL